MFNISRLSIPDANIDDLPHAGHRQVSTPDVQTSILLFPAAHDVSARRAATIAWYCQIEMDPFV
jgi:hypothetical protein